jgi:ATP-dependent DNA helicase DinG
VLVICDPRLLKKGYGQVFLDSMPPMARTRELAVVQGFFQDATPPGDAAATPPGG